ncbi:hypothetical protein CSOJ01_00756 [Colletotrichum sojae]|uniref:Uncharacterized protein n=1 Tax=Colletotrichum sojae TaxID=2175907 RepID=A0A8H6JXB8_9PEZI|nr:hypothetical protein CSOJ01_00756 [Colletotrichum sojae]
MEREERERKRFRGRKYLASLHFPILQSTGAKYLVFLLMGDAPSPPLPAHGAAGREERTKGKGKEPDDEAQQKQKHPQDLGDQQCGNAAKRRSPAVAVAVVVVGVVLPLSRSTIYTNGQARQDKVSLACAPHASQDKQPRSAAVPALPVTVAVPSLPPPPRHARTHHGHGRGRGLRMSLSLSLSLSLSTLPPSRQVRALPSGARHPPPAHTHTNNNPTRCGTLVRGGLALGRPPPSSHLLPSSIAAHRPRTVLLTRLKRRQT